MFLEVLIAQESMKEMDRSGENKVTFQFSFLEIAPSCNQHRK